MRPVLASLVEARADEHPGRVFLKMRPDVRMTWGEFRDGCRRVANGLIGAGLGSGDRIAIMAPNCPEFLLAHFGSIFAGLTPVPVNVSQRGETLRHLLADSGARAIVLGDDLRETYESLELRLNAFVLGSSFDELMQHPATAPPDRDAPGGIGVLYTSGTTGPPKGVVPTRTDITPLLALWQAMDVSAGETIYTCLPLFHGNPLGISVVGAMFLDASIAVSRKFSASAFWEEIRAFDAVEFNHVGAVIPILLKQPEREDDRANPVRTVLSAGCPPDAWEPFERRFGCRIVEQFSMVDAPGYLINHDGPRGSMGKPVAGCEAAILDPSGDEMKAGHVGELVLKATEGRTHYYLGAEAATEEAYRGGWFHTGDLAWRDEGGWFYYAGRAKESMRRRGENVSAWEVENVVNAHPAVLESAAHAVPSELGEDEIKVVVVPRPGKAPTPEQLIEFCRPRMAAYALPRYVEFRDEIPKTPTQRPRYADLRAEPITARTWDRETNRPGR